MGVGDYQCFGTAGMPAASVVVLNFTSEATSAWLTPALLSAGAILLFIGTLYYLKAINRHPAWAFLAFLSLPGLLLLALLEDIP